MQWSMSLESSFLPSACLDKENAEAQSPMLWTRFVIIEISLSQTLSSTECVVRMLGSQFWVNSYFQN